MKPLRILKSLKKPFRYLGPAFFLPVILITFMDFQKDLREMDKELLRAAHSVPLLLAEDFHDRTTGPNSITFEEELRNRALINRFNKVNGFTWTYTIIEQNSRIYMTAPTVTDEESANQERWYFFEYPQADKAFYRALKTGRSQFINYSDQWGHFRTLVLPLESPGGRSYAVCIDLNRSRIMEILIKTAGVKVGILLLGFLAALVYISYLTSTDPEKSQPSRHILMSREDLRKVIDLQTRHLHELSENERVNNLQLTNALYAGQMSLYSFNTGTGELDHAYNNLFSETLGYEHGQYRLHLDWLMEHMIAPEFRPELEKVYKDLLTGLISQESLDVKLLNIRGNYRWFRIHLSVLRGSENRKDSLLVLTQSIEDVKLREKDLLKQVQTDELTGLYNRSYWEEYFKALKSRNRRSDMPLVICFMDINGLKTVNDNLGHNAGDKLLTDFSHLIQRTVRASDIAVRLGGDEFLMISPQTYEQEFEELWHRLKENTEKFNKAMDRDYTLSYSHGICVLYDLSNDDEIDKLLEEADRKMYEEKRNMKKGDLQILRSPMNNHDPVG